MKKWISALLILALVITSACIAVNAGTPSGSVTFMLGDADGDNSITVLDATKIQRVLADIDKDDDGMIAFRGAVDGEEILNIMHATYIQRWLADFQVAYSIGEMVTFTPSEPSTAPSTEATVEPTSPATEAPTTPPTQAPTRDPDELPFVPNK